MSRYNICICRYLCIGTVSVSVETISVLPIRANTDARGRSRINVRQLQIAVGAVICTRTLNIMSKRRSPIWKYFTAGDSDRQATCNICSASVPRGGQSIKSFTTTNLVGHLRKHPTEFKQFEDAKSAAASSSEPQAQRSKRFKQITLEESSSRTKAWEIDDPRALALTTKIGEMIALDCQPLSLVDNVGFIRVIQAAEPRYVLPSRKYITERTIPQIHSRVFSKVKESLLEAKWLSCTSDIWSTEVSNDSLISLTAHWLSPTSFERRSTMLCASPLPGSHTGDAIQLKCAEMFDKWGIEHSQVHCFVTDNAANMKKAMTDGGYNHVGCFAHTLQLVVQDGILSQRYVNDILANCRRIVGHFKHSQLASSQLKTIQSSLGLPQHRLKQDVATRWNSSLYMLESILSQKVALAAYCTEHDGIPSLTSHQYEIIEKVIAVLKPIEDITQSISSDKASASIIIPYVRALRKCWENCSDDRGVRTMKKELLDSLNRRFCDVEENETLVIATMLDPCFKDKFFTTLVARDEAKSMLIGLVNEKFPPSDVDELSGSQTLERTDVMRCFDQILEEAGSSTQEVTSTTVVEQYLAAPLLHYHTGNACTWWAENRARFPTLSKLALQYLSPPPTSVPSERLFSTAGDIYDEKRNKLDPERAETLLFIKNNLQI